MVSIDHRRAAAFAPGEGPDYIRAGWELGQNLDLYIETVHRVNDVGAVFTWVGYGNSREGFDAEWRGINLMTVHGEKLSRSEVFDDSDVDAAIAKFDQLCHRTYRLENSASRLWELFEVSYPVRDWSAIAHMLAETVYTDDRRRPINSGLRRGPDALIAEMSALADVGIDITSEAVATRGEHLVLSRLRTVGRDQGHDGFGSVDLDVLEVGADGRGLARVVFNLNDFEAAIAELDARYLAGEAATYARTWSAITRAYNAISRREFPPTTPDWVSIDHRQGRAFAPGEMIPYVHAAWDVTPHASIYIETVHRLAHRGAVVTNAMTASSQERFDAEWREVFLLEFKGDKLDRCELFDEADLDKAIERFDELARPAQQFTNAAVRATERLRTCFRTRDWSGLADVLAEDIVADDRRRVVGLGLRQGREVNVADIRVGAEIGTQDITSTIVATRGDRLSLDRARYSMHDQQLDALSMELLRLVEVDDSGRMSACLMLDADEFDGALAELDARYLAGEAAPYSAVWATLIKWLRRAQPARASSLDTWGSHPRSPPRTRVSVRKTSSISRCLLETHAGNFVARRSCSPVELRRGGRHSCRAGNNRRWFRRRVA